MIEVLKFIVSGLSVGSIVALFFRWRDNERKKAAGSQLTVTDGVDHGLVRWAKVSLNSWTGTVIKIDQIRIVWPLSLTGYAYADHPNPGVLTLYGPSIELPEGSRVVNLLPPAEIPIGKTLRITFFVLPSVKLRSSNHLSRLLVLVSGRTLDAQRRRVRLLLRSDPVDWSKKPQE